MITFTSGANHGLPLELRGHVLNGATATLELCQAAPNMIEAADAFSISAGCDKTFTTCRTRFSNGMNFRGFPLMPGNDFVISYPRRGDGHTGGSLQ